MLDMIVQPEALEEHRIGMFCACYASATGGTILGGTLAGKRRIHVPLGAWVSNVEGPVISDPDLKFGRIET